MVLGLKVFIRLSVSSNDRDRKDVYFAIKCKRRYVDSTWSKYVPGICADSAKNIPKLHGNGE